MSAQTSYTIKIPQAYAGQIYDLNPRDVVSRDVEGAAGFDFGVAVSRGTDPDRQALLGGTAFLGISLRSLDREGVINTGAIKYNEKETAAIMREGYVWAVCPSGCVPGDLVNYVNATGVLDSGAAVAGETQLDDAKWETTTAAGQIGLIRIEGSGTTAGA